LIVGWFFFGKDFLKKVTLKIYPITFYYCLIKHKN